MVARLQADRDHHEMQYRTKEQTLRSVPRFSDDGSVNWRDHESAIRKFMMIRREYIGDNDSFKKQILLESIGGTANRRLTENHQVAELYDLGTYEEYKGAVRQAFMPDSERVLLRTEFMAYTQSRSQDIGSYFEAKCSLFLAAYEEGERSFDILMTQVIKGIINTCVKREVRRRSPRNQGELRKAVIEATAAERDAYSGGYSESPNLDGLGTVSTYGRNLRIESNVEAPTPMEVDAFGERRCHRCGRTSHLKADCRAKKTADGKDIVDKPSGGKRAEDRRPRVPRKKGRCYSCGKDGHHARECRSTKRTNPPGANAIVEEDAWEEVNELRREPFLF